MDNTSIIAPKVTDFIALEEFMESLHDAAPSIERDISQLRNTPEDHAILSELFRSLHNIKGDAALCQVQFAVAVAHPVESLLARLRNGEIAFSDLLAEAILLAVDRLELAVEALHARRPMDNLRLPVLVDKLEVLAVAAPGDLHSRARDLIEAVTGFSPSADSSVPSEDPLIEPSDASLPRMTRDLQFFRSLAESLEARSPLFKGRTLRLLRLASETNQLRGSPVDPRQLEAAVYMHDVGMMFLPEAVWLKVERMTDEERQVLHQHPRTAAGLLSRMPGWDTAAEAVLQHHEMPDGGGYPTGLGGHAICDGAKLLAIVDAFEAVMLKHAHRGKSRSVLRAVAEINACDKQFAPEWIEPFNQVIHRSISR